MFDLESFIPDFVEKIKYIFEFWDLISEIITDSKEFMIILSEISMYIPEYTYSLLER